MEHELSEKAQGKESMMDYEVIGTGEEKSILFGAGIASLAKVEQAIVKEFPGVSLDQISVAGTYDQELVIGLTSKLTRKP